MKRFVNESDFSSFYLPSHIESSWSTASLSSFQLSKCSVERIAILSHSCNTSKTHTSWHVNVNTLQFNWFSCVACLYCCSCQINHSSRRRATTLHPVNTVNRGAPAGTKYFLCGHIGRCKIKSNLFTCSEAWNCQKLPQNMRRRQLQEYKDTERDTNVHTWMHWRRENVVVFSTEMTIPPPLLVK